jgi:hypothetical protein
VKKNLMLCPHHALCLQFFIGKGYGDDFVAGMAEIQRALWEHEDRTVLLVAGTDQICARCPNNRAGVCEAAEKSDRYDQKCLHVFGLKTGQSLSWRNLIQIVKRTAVLSPRVRASICSDCGWDSVCRKQQAKLLAAMSVSMETEKHRR